MIKDSRPLCFGASPLFRTSPFFRIETLAFKDSRPLFRKRGIKDSRPLFGGQRFKRDGGVVAGVISSAVDEAT